MPDRYFDQERDRLRDRGDEYEESRERRRESADYGRERRGEEWERDRWPRGEGPYTQEEQERRQDESRRAGSEWGREGGRGYEDYAKRRELARDIYHAGDWERQRSPEGDLFGTGQRGFGTTWAGSIGRPRIPGWDTPPALGRYAGRGPKGYRRSDDRIHEDVCERLTEHPYIDASEVEVQVRNGEVTLSGTVERRDMKRMAEDVAESVSGVRDVHNQIRVQSQTMTAGGGPVPGGG